MVEPGQYIRYSIHAIVVRSTYRLEYRSPDICHPLVRDEEVLRQVHVNNRDA